MNKVSDRAINNLEATLDRMIDIVRAQLENVVRCLDRSDSISAEEAVKLCAHVEATGREVEDAATVLLATRQPMAVDLRQVIAAICVAKDLEWIADLARGVSARSMEAAGNQTWRPHSSVSSMARSALCTFDTVIKAYRGRDVTEAHRVLLSDLELDSLYNTVFRALTQSMTIDSRAVGQTVDMLFQAKDLERVGDHCTNIAESVIFLVQGFPIVGNRPKDDQIS
jgi:phosphate transport system protein